jgi:hypothetical protein
MGYRKGDKMFSVFPTNWKGEEEFVANHIHKWDIHWKATNASFEEAFNANEDLQRFNGRMFFVCVGNHQLQAWMPYISRVHSDDLSWHIAADSIMLNMRKGLVHLLNAIIDMNK